jgi:hypothetical protein
VTRRHAVRALIEKAGQLARCKAARAAWVRETAAAWRAAQRAMDERCGAAVDRLSEKEFERLFDEEQAKIDAFRAPLQDAALRDVWPPHLYFAAI